MSRHTGSVANSDYRIVRELFAAGANGALNYQALMNLFVELHVASLKIYEICFCTAALLHQ
jgi:hypothetical protein